MKSSTLWPWSVGFCRSNSNKAFCLIRLICLNLSSGLLANGSCGLDWCLDNTKDASCKDVNNNVHFLEQDPFFHFFCQSQIKMNQVVSPGKGIKSNRDILFFSLSYQIWALKHKSISCFFSFYIYYPQYR